METISQGVTMNKQTLWYLFATLILLSSCLSTGSEDAVNNIDFDIANHSEQQKLFQETRPENYSYIYYSSGFMYDHFRVYVSKGIVDSLVDQGEYESHVTWGSNIQYYHIDSLFKEITTIYDNNNGIKTAGKDYYITEITCSYDDTWHFPTNYSYNYYSAPYIEVDGNFGAQISDFRVEE